MGSVETNPSLRASIGRWLPDWRGVTRQLFGAACDGCGERLSVGHTGALCVVCDVASEPIGVWRTGPWGLPLLAGWRYGGPIASTLVGAKFRGEPFDPRPWMSDLHSGLAEQVRSGDALVPIAPHVGRLRGRGRHIPDDIARGLRQQWAGGPRPAVVWRALDRLDDARPRSADETVCPHFAARVTGHAVWLIDDVITSGRTLAAAYEAFAACGVEIRGAICLADAGEHRRPFAAVGARSSGETVSTAILDSAS